MSGGGDTPTEQTLFKYVVNQGAYLIGKIVPGRNDFVNVGIYGPDSERFYVVNEQGTCIADSGMITDYLRQDIVTACEHTLDKQAEIVEAEIQVITIGSEIENWDEYQLISKP